MVVEGMIVNGRVEVAVPAAWTDGTRVTVALADADVDDLDFDFEPPPETETHDEFLESLRQEVADIKAGIPGIPLEQMVEELAQEFNFPRVSRD